MRKAGLKPDHRPATGRKVCSAVYFDTKNAEAQRREDAEKIPTGFHHSARRCRVSGYAG